MQSIPVLASVLGNRYGIEIVITGDVAMTDGSTIYLPSLPLDCDDTFLGLLRGYLDHEAAHIRYTDFDLLQSENLTNFEQFVWNSIEDWRIEQLMASHFSGCKLNFHWLIHHVFCEKKKKRKVIKLDEILAEWILLSIRAWDVQELEVQTKVLEKQINMQCPKLLDELGAILLEVKNKCKSCEDALNYTKVIVACIEKYINQLEQENQITKQTQSTNSNNTQGENKNENSISNNNETSAITTTECTNEGQGDLSSNLRNLLDGNSTCLPRSTGEIAKQEIEKVRSGSHRERLRVALTGIKNVRPLSKSVINHALRVSASLKARLQGLLQAQNLERRTIALHGKINKNRLHGLAVNDTKVFLQKSKIQTENTAIHILLDTSGSMRGKIGIASEACFALGKSLENTKNINIGISAFPAIQGYAPAGVNSVYVYELVRHGEKVSDNFEITQEGGTPLTEALWWVFPRLLAQKEERKIILLITDGEPDNRDTAMHAIEYAEKIGIEIYGIGIPPCIIEDVLPNRSIRIENVNELPQAMFGLLQTALIKKTMERKYE